MQNPHRVCFACRRSRALIIGLFFTRLAIGTHCSTQQSAGREPTSQSQCVHLIRLLLLLHSRPIRPTACLPCILTVQVLTAADFCEAENSYSSIDGQVVVTLAAAAAVCFYIIIHSFV